jgi:hypothetical protein
VESPPGLYLTYGAPRPVHAGMKVVGRERAKEVRYLILGESGTILEFKRLMSLVSFPMTRERICELPEARPPRLN